MDNRNATSDYGLTVLVPYYNETENILKLEERLSAFLPTCSVPACILFVNDGSTDGGDQLVAQACSRREHFYSLDLAHNCGLSGALRAGIEACRSPLVGYIDADLQTDPADFNLLLDAMEGAALATGVRMRRNDGFVKRSSSRIANGWRRMMTGDGAADTGCPLKILRIEYARRLPLFKGMHRFIPALVLMQGGTYREIPVRHYPRTAGRSKYHLLNRLAGPFMDCFAYRWMRKRYTDNTVIRTRL